jgi:hypothetical protein
MFAHGKVESATVEVPFVVPAGLIAAAPQAVVSYFCATIEQLPPGRAPPAISSPEVQAN